MTSLGEGRGAVLSRSAAVNFTGCGGSPPSLEREKEPTHIKQTVINLPREIYDNEFTLRRYINRPTTETARLRPSCGN